MNADTILQNLRQEFLDDANDRVVRLQDWIDKLGPKADLQGLLTSIRREAHNLKGMGGTFGFPFVSTLAHRMEDYIQQREGKEVEFKDDLHIFVDFIADVIEATENPTPEQEKNILRRLPNAALVQVAHTSDDANSEVLVVTHSSTVAHILGLELGTRGLKVITELDPFMALKSAVNGHPDYLIASAVLPGISGIDLVNAMNAMSPTSALPCAIVSSFNRGHYELKDLGNTTPLIRLGNFMSSDIVSFLENKLAESA